jgi:hypothetical protein
LMKAKEWLPRWNGCEPLARNCGKKLNESRDESRQRRKERELCNLE